MTVKVFFIVAYFFGYNVSFSQKYFDFLSTNIPKVSYDKYSISFDGAYGWLGTGNYSWPENCADCFDYARDSKLKKEMLDSLVRIYKQNGFARLYSKVYVPNYKQFVTDKVKAAPYIIKTLYKIEGNKPIALQQLKIIFFDRPNNKPGVLRIEIIDEKHIKQYDPKVIMTAYNSKVKEDSSETPPPIEKQ